MSTATFQCPFCKNNFGASSAGGLFQCPTCKQNVQVGAVGGGAPKAPPTATYPPATAPGFAAPPAQNPGYTPAAGMYIEYIYL